MEDTKVLFCGGQADADGVLFLDFFHQGQFCLQQILASFCKFLCFKHFFNSQILCLFGRVFFFFFFCANKEILINPNFKTISRLQVAKLTFILWILRFQIANIQATLNLVRINVPTALYAIKCFKVSTNFYSKEQNILLYRLTILQDQSLLQQPLC